MKLLSPAKAISICVIIGLFAITIAVLYGSDKGAVAIAGVGALGQVIVAVLLYYITRDQLEHIKFEARYRRIEQKIAKQERTLDEMDRTQVVFRNAKTGIGQKSYDPDQILRLVSLQDDMRRLFVQPVSTEYNKMVVAAKAAGSLQVGSASYRDSINDYILCGDAVFTNTQSQLAARRDDLDRARNDLESLAPTDNSGS